ncbi:hypothetical protein [Ottowia oryzae]
MLGYFEKRLPPYPDPEPRLPPKGFMAFVWAATPGVRGYVATLAVLSAAISVYDALLFAMLGRVVDWLGQVTPATLWTDRGPMLTVLAVILLASIGLGRVNTNSDCVHCGGYSGAWRSRPSNSPRLSTACPSSVATSA